MFESLGVADWVVYYMIMNYVGLAIFGVYLLYRSRFKIAFLAVFYRKGSKGSPAGGYRLVRDDNKNVVDVEMDVGGESEYVYVGEKEFKKTDLSVEFGKRTFTINMEAPCYRKYGYTMYAFDVERGDTLRFGDQIKSMSPLVAQRHLKHQLFQRILQAGSLKTEYWIILIAMCVMVGLAVGMGAWHFAYEAGVERGLNMTSVVVPTQVPLPSFP